MTRLHDTQSEVSIPECCSLFGYSKQAYYKRQKQLETELLAEEIILKMVSKVRETQPVLGGRKLYHILKTKIHRDMDIGRDKFFALLRANGLLMRKSKTYRPITTQSWKHYHKYSNLIKDYEPSSANQLYVADITYIRNVEDRFYYLSLLTDAYSRKIVGWSLEDSLEMSGPIKALKMALEALPQGSSLIHHSDRGVQYCSKEYTSILQRIKSQISMTENGDPRENAIAERVNGILKEEWLNREHITTLSQARHVVGRVIDIYNNQRPHSSVEMLTPAEAHLRNGPLKRKWKTIYKQSQTIVLPNE